MKNWSVQSIAKWLDSYLDINAYMKSDIALNGLQVSALNKQVKKIGLAVDACLSTFHLAKEKEVDLLIVHHGIFWGRQSSITGTLYERLKFLQEHDIALYAAHLPLDAHMESGNNVAIAKHLGVVGVESFGEYKGMTIGVKGHWTHPTEMKQICKKMSVSNEGQDYFNFGQSQVKTVGIVSGGAPSMVAQAIDMNLDLYITGEVCHDIYHLCKEREMNAIFAGHYHTETGGVKAVGTKLHEEFGTECEFIDNPTYL